MVYRSYPFLTSPKNWAVFKLVTKFELIAKEHWQVVSGDELRPQNSSYMSSSGIEDDKVHASASISVTSEQEDWDYHNKQALAIIVSRLGQKYKVQYATATTASTLWKALCTQHEFYSSICCFNLLLEIPRITLAGCNNDINAYSNKFLRLRAEQILANSYGNREDNYTENQLVMFYIGGLKSSTQWEQFVLNCFQKNSLPSSLESIVQLSREEQHFRSNQRRLANRRA